MAFDPDFLFSCQKLYKPGMGTEAAAPLLYSLVRMLRPSSVMEVGLGYTTPFLAQALYDAMAEAEEDRAILAGEVDSPGRAEVLHPNVDKVVYRPKIIAIDDFAEEAGGSGHQALEVLKELELDHLVEVRQGDFRGQSGNLGLAPNQPLDFVWFDAGGPREYLDFLKEYWPILNPNYGTVLFHFTYWNLQLSQEPGKPGRRVMLPSPLINELKRQEVAAGGKARFEILSLLEPHKKRQGSVTLLRKIPPPAFVRPLDFKSEMQQISGKDDWGDVPNLA